MSLVGKKVAINSLILSKVYFFSRCSPVSNRFIKEIYESIKKFLGQERYLFNLLLTPVEKGGFGLLNIKEQTSTLWLRTFDEIPRLALCESPLKNIIVKFFLYDDITLWSINKFKKANGRKYKGNCPQNVKSWLKNISKPLGKSTFRVN